MPLPSSTLSGVPQSTMGDSAVPLAEVANSPVYLPGASEMTSPGFAARSALSSSGAVLTLTLAVGHCQWLSGAPLADGLAAGREAVGSAPGRGFPFWARAQVTTAAASTTTTTAIRPIVAIVVHLGGVCRPLPAL